MIIEENRYTSIKIPISLISIFHLGMYVANNIHTILSSQTMKGTVLYLYKHSFIPFNKMLFLVLAIWYNLSYFIPWNTVTKTYYKLEVAVLYISSPLPLFVCSSMHRHNNFSRWASLDMCQRVPHLCQDSLIYLGVISFPVSLPGQKKKSTEF